MLRVVADYSDLFAEGIVNCNELSIIDFQVEGQMRDDSFYVLILTSKPDLKSHQECISNSLSSIKMEFLEIYSFICSKAAKNTTSVVTLLKCSNALQQQAMVAHFNDSFDTTNIS